MNKKEAEKIVREVIQSHAGEQMEDDLFKNSVNLLLAEVNDREILSNMKTDTMAQA